MTSWHTHMEHLSKLMLLGVGVGCFNLLTGEAWYWSLIWGGILGVGGMLLYGVFVYLDDKNSEKPL